jgi:hypothetical protein
MRTGLVRAGEQAAGTGKDLLQPGGRRCAQALECACEDAAAFDAPVGAYARRRQVSQAEIGDERMERTAVLAEHLAELGVGHQVSAVICGGDAKDAPRPGGHQPALRSVDASQGLRGLGASLGAVPRMARTVGVISAAEAATMSIW